MAARFAANVFATTTALLVIIAYSYRIPTAQALTIVAMASSSWRGTWSDILSGGPKRWKVDDLSAKKIALSHILRHHDDEGDGRQKLRILCPLAGDDPFVHYAWSEGHAVTAIDIVPEALEAMRSQFEGAGGSWTSESAAGSAGDGSLVWTHSSGRATLIEGDILAKRPHLAKSFDAIYDKDSFGALNLEMRSPFCKRLSEYIKDDGTLYVEVKNKEQGRDNGPPYHVEQGDLMEASNFGECFVHIANLGEVYQLGMPGMKQTGHVLRRVLRR